MSIETNTIPEEVAMVEPSTLSASKKRKSMVEADDQAAVYRALRGEAGACFEVVAATYQGVGYTIPTDHFTRAITLHSSSKVPLPQMGMPARPHAAVGRNTTAHISNYGSLLSRRHKSCCLLMVRSDMKEP